MSDGMKKRDLREALEQAQLQTWNLAEDVKRLKAEIETMRKHWRPVPIAHPWQPRNPQCALCDDTRDAPRHQEGAEPQAVIHEQEATIQRVKERLLWWAEQIDGDTDWSKGDIFTALREMRQTAEEL